MHSLIPSSCVKDVKSCDTLSPSPFGDHHPSRHLVGRHLLTTGAHPSSDQTGRSLNWLGLPHLHNTDKGRGGEGPKFFPGRELRHLSEHKILVTPIQCYMYCIWRWSLQIASLNKGLSYILAFDASSTDVDIRLLWQLVSPSWYICAQLHLVGFSL